MKEKFSIRAFVSGVEYRLRTSLWARSEVRRVYRQAFTILGPLLMILGLTKVSLAEGVISLEVDGGTIGAHLFVFILGLLIITVRLTWLKEQ